MKEMSVTYLISEEEYERLIKISTEYKKQGLDLSLEKTFESIMTYGSKYDVDEKLKFHEKQLGLRDGSIPNINPKR